MGCPAGVVAKRADEEAYSSGCTDGIGRVSEGSSGPFEKRWNHPTIEGRASTAFNAGAGPPRNASATSCSGSPDIAPRKDANARSTRARSAGRYFRRRIRSSIRVFVFPPDFSRTIRSSSQLRGRSSGRLASDCVMNALSPSAGRSAAFPRQAGASCTCARSKSSNDSAWNSGRAVSISKATTPNE